LIGFALAFNEYKRSVEAPINSSYNASGSEEGEIEDDEI
jgi:PTS system mannose-specific IIC component